MTTTLTPTPIFQWIGTNGQPLVGGLLYSYAAGTSTPLATFADSTGTTANPNPVVLDSAGSAAVWLASASYKLVLKDTFNNVLWTVDNINAVQGAFLPTTGGTLYQPSANTTLDINSDAGMSSSLITQIGGVNSTRFYSTTQGTGGIGAADGLGSFTQDAISFDKFGNVTIGLTLILGSNTASNVFQFMNSAPGFNRLFTFQSAGKSRWSINCNADAESGSNSGSNFALVAWGDNGSTNLGNAIFINRATTNATVQGTWTGPNFIATSDPRLKKSMRSLSASKCIQWVKEMVGISFKRKRGGRTEVGFNAKSVQMVCPEIVHEDDNGFLGIDYDKITAIHNVALKNILERLEALEHDASK